MRLGEMIGWGESPWGPLLLGVAAGLLIGPTLRQGMQQRSHSYIPATSARASMSAELNRMADEATAHQ